MRPLSPWYQNQIEIPSKKEENDRSVSVMNTGEKILDKVLANWIQQDVKRIIQHHHMGFIPGMKRFFNLYKSVWYTTLTKGKTKTHDRLSKCRKSIWQNSTSFTIKTLTKVAVEETYLNIIKGSYNKPTANSEKLKAFPLNSGKRQGCPLLTLHSTQYCKSSPQQSYKKKK